MLREEVEGEEVAFNYFDDGLVEVTIQAVMELFRKSTLNFCAT